MRFRTLQIPLLLLLVGACAGRVQPAGRVESNLLGRAALDSAGSVSAYDAVVRLRPSYLRGRGPTSLLNAGARARPVVFVDQSEYGEIESLRSLTASRIEEIRFFPGPEATTKFGSPYGAGVIQLKMRVE
jgi:hypothetical protein